MIIDFNNIYINIFLSILRMISDSKTDEDNFTRIMQLFFNAHDLNGWKINLTLFDGLEWDKLGFILYIKAFFNCYIGPDGSSTKLADGQCGKAVATHYSTSQRYAFIRMTSDATLEKVGLLVEYVAAKDYCTNFLHFERTFRILNKTFD